MYFKSMMICAALMTALSLNHQVNASNNTLLSHTLNKHKHDPNNDQDCGCQQAPACHGHWEPLKNQPTFLHGVGAPLLLTDGSVLFQEQLFPLPSTLTSPNNAYGNIWKLTPDRCGSYVNGTWSQLASLPDDYAPCFYASAVLPDGRVIFEGGEVNGLNNFVWQSNGAIYDSLSNAWTTVAPPPFFTNSFGPPPVLPIGDASSVILEDGTFMLAIPKRSIGFIRCQDINMDSNGAEQI